MFEENPQRVIFAVALALALLGIAAIPALMAPQSAAATGCHTSIAFNAGQGHCFRP